MKADCVSDVEKALKRRLSEREADAIEQRIRANIREAARADPEFMNKPREQRLMEAAQRALEQDLAEAAKTAQRKSANLLAQVREAARLEERAKQVGGKHPFHRALAERLNQVNQYAHGVRNEIMSTLMDTVAAAEPRFLGLMHDAAAMRDFVREVFRPGSTGNQVAARGAKAYGEAMEQARLRSNAAGTAIRKLDYGYLPQPHDLSAVVRSGREAWVQFTLPRLNRERYVTEDGAPMTDVQLAEFLGHAYETISTEGRNQLVPGSFRGGSRASRADDAHRSIHFAGADAYLAYMNEFGRAGSVYEAILGHVGVAAKNIGLMEEFGANPNLTFRLLKDLAEKGDNAAGKREFGAGLDQIWDTLNGTTAQPVSANLADFGQGVRTFIAAVKLQGVILSSINDLPMLAASAVHNGMPLGKTLVTVLKSFGGDAKQDAARVLAATDYVAGEMSRWHGENQTAGWTSKLATVTHKASFIEAWTHGLRRGFTVMHAATLNDLRAHAWRNLSDGDRARLTGAGVTEADWRIWRAAKPVDFRGQKVLSAEGVRAVGRDKTGIADPAEHERAINTAVSRLLGFLDQESHIAVMAPDLVTRAAIQQGTRAGSLGGELMRSLLLFKSFPLAMVFQNLRRMRTMTGKGKLAYSMATMTALTLFGALSVQLKDLVTGKDPRDMTQPKFWGAAFAQGGGLGVFGDIAYTGLGGNSRGGQPNYTSLAGPVFGTALDLANLSLGNIGAKLQGKDAHLAEELFRFGRQNTPFINLWYLKAALNHALLDDIQESISPGYLARQRERARKDWGQRYWWDPGQPLPARGPDLEAAVGQ